MKLFNFVGKGKRDKKRVKRNAKKVVAAKSYSVEEKMRILKEYEAAQGTITMDRFCKWWGISIGGLKKWQEQYNAEGEAGLEARPRHRPKTEIAEAIKEKVIEYKQNNPRAGGKRISDYFRRHKFWKISAEAVRQIMKSDERTAGLMMIPHRPKDINKRPVIRFERSRPRQLYQMDIMTWMLKGLYRVYIIACLDDHSRFIVSWGLFRRQTGGHVVDVLRGALERYDYPEEILTDNGRQFYVWRGKSEFQKFVIKSGIKHIRSRPYHPATLGKIESFWRNLYQELLSQKAISSFEEAEAKLKEWIDYYNFKRPHQGIAGLVPADRFFGVEKPVQETMIQGANIVKDSLVLNPKEVKEPMYLIGRIGGKELRIIAKEGSVVVEGLEDVKKRCGDARSDDIKYSQNNGGVGNGNKPCLRNETESPERSMEQKEDSDGYLQGAEYKPADILQMGEKSAVGDTSGPDGEEERPEGEGGVCGGDSEAKGRTEGESEGAQESGTGKETDRD